MKSIPLALTWEFWRQATFALFTTVAILCGLMALIYGGLRLDRFYVRDTMTFTNLHVFCFVVVVFGLAGTICHVTGSPQQRFTLPISVRASIFVPMINGALATVIGYLAVALVVNELFSAQWSLLKPAVVAVCVISVGQAVAWMFPSSSNLRSTVVPGICTVLCLVVMYLNGIHDPEQLATRWYAIGPLDISLAIVVPISAYLLSLLVLTLARRGQVFSMSAMGRWLIAKLNVRFASGTHAATPMAAELWAEWTVRGRVMPAGAILITMILCGFFLSGRFEWRSACAGIAVSTWLQLMSGALVGLFLGHVGERFDFHEHLATRPLSDAQLADVKLWNTLKSVAWTWITWTLGLAVAVACLALVGQGPTGWHDIVPRGTPWFVPFVVVVLVPLGSWTLTSLGVCIGVLRPWSVLALLNTLVLLPAVGYALQLLMPESDAAILAGLQWVWTSLIIGGTIALYVTAFRMRLITAKRIAVAAVAYMLFGAVCLFTASFLMPDNIQRGLAYGLLASSCMLPLVCIAAVPLAIWWNRHR